MSLNSLYHIRCCERTYIEKSIKNSDLNTEDRGSREGSMGGTAERSKQVIN